MQIWLEKQDFQIHRIKTSQDSGINLKSLWKKNLKPVTHKYLLLTSLLMVLSAQSASAGGCNSSLFSPAGQLRFLEFELTCAISYLLLLLTKTGLITWFNHQSGFWLISVRIFSGTFLSLVLAVVICFYAYLNLVNFFRDPLIFISLLIFFVSLSTTLSDCMFALNWQKLGYKQVALDLTLSLFLNICFSLGIYLAFFANLKNFFG